jgi:hypothetical protein
MAMQSNRVNTVSHAVSHEQSRIFDIEEHTFAQKGFNCSDHFTAAANSMEQ